MTLPKRRAPSTAGLASLALPQAVKANNLDTIATLLAAGADPDTISNNVPVMAVAARNGFDRALTLLLEAGGNVDQTDGSGHSILRAAMEAHETVCVKKLLEAGADPCNVSYDIKFERDISDWEYASQASHFDVAAPVLSAAAAFRLNDAVSKGKHAVALDLLTKGIRADTFDRFGKTALIHACERGEVEMAARLLSAGADPNLAGIGGDTPLHAAVLAGRADIADILMTAGARAQAANAFGLSPLQIARKGGDHGLINVLESHIERQEAEAARSVTTLSRPAKALKTVRFRPPGGPRI